MLGLVENEKDKKQEEFIFLEVIAFQVQIPFQPFVRAYF